MKEIFNTRKKRIAILILLVLVFIGFGVSYALLFREFTVANKFKTMTYNVELEEEFHDQFGTKRVTITNKDETNTPVVLRLNYNESWTNKEGNETIYLNNFSGNYNCVYKIWTDSFLNDFILGSDGWYYYKKVLGPEEGVTVIEAIADNGCGYNDSTYHLDFNYEAIQADINAVQENWDKTIAITDKTVTWPFTGSNPNRNQLRHGS